MQIRHLESSGPTDREKDIDSATNQYLERSYAPLDIGLGRETASTFYAEIEQKLEPTSQRRESTDSDPGISIQSLASDRANVPSIRMPIVPRTSQTTGRGIQPPFHNPIVPRMQTTSGRHNAAPSRKLSARRAGIASNLMNRPPSNAANTPTAQ